jgi:hypothetical protein
LFERNKLEREGYFKKLSDDQLDQSSVKQIQEYLGQKINISPVPQELLKASKSSPAINAYLSRLSLCVALGKKSWNGLVVGFPGTEKDLTSYHVGTTYLRKILYPLLDLFERLKQHSPDQFRCIYFIGRRFPDVFLRKFHLLDSTVPNVIVLTADLLKAATVPPKLHLREKFDERWAQIYLAQKLQDQSGLSIPTSSGRETRAGFLAIELQASEGTARPEQLDILAYDHKNKSLIAFELKGPSCSRTEFENLFLQGMEHRNWLENNKMAVKLCFDGPATGKINSTKRVRLILGFFQRAVPPLFYKLREVAMSKDKYLKIDFVQISGSPTEGLSLTSLTSELSSRKL